MKRFRKLYLGVQIFHNYLEDSPKEFWVESSSCFVSGPKEEEKIEAASASADSGAWTEADTLETLFRGYLEIKCLN